MLLCSQKKKRHTTRHKKRFFLLIAGCVVAQKFVSIDLDIAHCYDFACRFFVGDFFILISESSSSGAGQKCCWIVDHLRKTSDFTMLSVNGQQFSPEKVLFLPRPLGFLEVVFLLVILAGLSLVSRRNLDGLSKLVIYFCVAFSPYLQAINTLFAP